MQKKWSVQCRRKCCHNWTCEEWFAKFHAWDFSLYDAPHLSRPVQVNSDQDINWQQLRLYHNSKYPNQKLKIICTNLVMLITLILGFHIS